MWCLLKSLNEAVIGAMAFFLLRINGVFWVVWPMFFLPWQALGAIWVFGRVRPIVVVLFWVHEIYKTKLSRETFHMQNTSSADKLLTSTFDSDVEFGAPPRSWLEARVTSVLQREELPDCLSDTAVCRPEQSGICFRSQFEAVMLGLSR